MIPIFRRLLLALVLVGTSEAISALTADEPYIHIIPIIESDTQEKFVCKLYTNGIDTVSDFRWWDDTSDTIIDQNYSAIHSNIQVKTISEKERQLELSWTSLYLSTDGNFKCSATVESRILTATIFRHNRKNGGVTILFTDASYNQQAVLGTKYKMKCNLRLEYPNIPAGNVIQWAYSDGTIQTQISNNNHYIIEPDGLFINEVRESDELLYTCYVFLSERNIIGRTFRLEVVPPPNAVHVTSSQSVTEGEKATFVCTATGKPKPEISWTKGPNHQVLSKGIDGILHIERVTKDDDGDYTCVAKNEHGEYRRSTHLNVRSRPNITHVKNDSAKVGAFAQIQCIVYANPKPFVSIRKIYNSRKTPGVDITRDLEAVRMVDDPKQKHVFIVTRNFTSVESSDDGLYECTADNELGSSISDVDLTVGTAPIFNDTVFRCSSGEINLTCVVEAIPNATIVWSFNNKLIETNDQVYTILGKGSSSTLQIKHLDDTLKGQYQCQAHNIHGTVSQGFFVQDTFFLYSLGHIFDLSIATDTIVNMTISKPLDTDALCITRYFVQYKKDTNTWKEAVNYTRPFVGTLEIRNLNPSTSYDFCIAAERVVGGTLYSETKIIFILNNPLPREPTIFAPQNNGEKFVKLETAETLKLKWQTPSGSGTEIDKYRLEICDVHENPSEPDGFDKSLKKTCKFVELPTSEVSNSYTITDLIPDTFYRVTLQAHDYVGYGKSSTRVFRTHTSIFKSTSSKSIARSDPSPCTTFLLILVGLIVIETILLLFFIYRVIMKKRRRSTRNQNQLQVNNRSSPRNEMINDDHQTLAATRPSSFPMECKLNETYAMPFSPNKKTSQPGASLLPPNYVQYATIDFSRFTTNSGRTMGQTFLPTAPEERSV